MSWFGREHDVSSEDLSAYLDGELEPRRVAPLERHLQSCLDCRRELATLRETKRLLQGLPQRAVPRSFVIPASAVVQRRQNRLWDTGFVVFRGATLALSLALVLTLSGNALLSSGRLGLFGSKSAVSDAATVQPDPLGVTQDRFAGAAAAAEEPPRTVAAQQAQAAPRAMAAEQAPAAAASDQVPEDAGSDALTSQPARKVSPADQQGPLTALVTEPRPDAQPAAEPAGDGMGAGVGGADNTAALGAMALAAAPEGEGTLAPGAEVMTAALAPEMGAGEQAEPLAAESTGDVSLPEALNLEELPTRVPTSTAEVQRPAVVAPTLTPQLSEAPKPPTAQAAAAVIEPKEPVEPAAEIADRELIETDGGGQIGEAEPDAVAATISTDALADRMAMWRRHLGVTASLVAGVLLMSAAGLLWTAHMRRR